MISSKSRRRSALVIAQLFFSVVLLASNAWADTHTKLTFSLKVTKTRRP
jgi:hypothetical protein